MRKLNIQGKGSKSKNDVVEDEMLKRFGKFGESEADYRREFFTSQSVLMNFSN